MRLFFIIWYKFQFVLVFILFTSSALSQLSDANQIKLDEYVNTASNFSANGEFKKAAASYYKAGMFCLEKGQNKLSLPYFKESANNYANIEDYEKVMKVYSNIGLVYTNLNEYDKALLYFQNSLKIRRSIGDNAQIASGLLDLAYILGIKQNHKDAIVNVLKALDIANEINNTKLVLVSYRMLAENYSKIGNEQKASEYIDKFSTVKQYYQKSESEERVSEERTKSIAELNIAEEEARLNQLRYQLNMQIKEIEADTLKMKIKEREDSLAIVELNLQREKEERERLETERELQKIKEENEKAQQRLIYIAFGGGTLFILLIAGGLLINNRRRKRHNVMLAETNRKIAEQNKNIELKNEELTDAFQKIDEQNKDINSSIDYAATIQKSLLPAQEQVKLYIEDSFILFKPRDKVSGDFYWFKDALIANGDGSKHKKIFISAIDCTGHGVPGAFLSMISYNILENIIEQKKIFDPGNILDELHTGVRKTLRQHETNNRDGMDMALCCYDPQENIIEFAGAKNPLIYMSEGKIYRVKGDIKPIGGIIHEKSEGRKFQSKSIEITAPTTAYIFSDGFADQIGEETGRKLMTKFFRNLLAEIHHKPMDEQKEILELFLKKWQGNMEQIDDIIVIGFKVSPNKI